MHAQMQASTFTYHPLHDQREAWCEVHRLVCRTYEYCRLIERDVVRYCVKRPDVLYRLVNDAHGVIQQVGGKNVYVDMYIVKEILDKFLRIPVPPPVVARIAKFIPEECFAKGTQTYSEEASVFSVLHFMRNTVDRV